MDLAGGVSAGKTVIRAPCDVRVVSWSLGIVTDIIRIGSGIFGGPEWPRFSGLRRVFVSGGTLVEISLR